LDVKGKEKIFNFQELKEILKRIDYIVVLDSSSFVVSSRFEPIIVSGCLTVEDNKPPEDYLA